jgi:hypothetical protein
VVQDELPPATKVKLYLPEVAPTAASPTANGGVAGLHELKQILISTAVEGPGEGVIVPDTLIDWPDV